MKIRITFALVVVLLWEKQIENLKSVLCVHSQAVEEEDKMTPEQLAIKNVGKQVRRL